MGRRSGGWFVGQGASRAKPCHNGVRAVGRGGDTTAPLADLKDEERLLQRLSAFEVVGLHHVAGSVKAGIGQAQRRDDTITAAFGRAEATKST